MLRIPAAQAGTATAIFFHGLGDSGAGMKFLAAESHRRPELQHVNFVLPTAPIRYFAAFGGSTTGWFDFSPTGPNGERGIEDVAGMEESLKLLNSLIEQEIARGIPASRILVGGFSQGSMLAQATAFTSKHKLAGFTPLSGRLPTIERLKEKRVDTNLNTPVFLAHGTEDDIIPVAECDNSLAAFKECGFTNVEAHKYPDMGHSLCLEELEELIAFIKRMIP